jgi:hypothetical protein
MPPNPSIDNLATTRVAPTKRQDPANKLRGFRAGLKPAPTFGKHLRIGQVFFVMMNVHVEIVDAFALHFGKFLEISRHFVYPYRQWIHE